MAAREGAAPDNALSVTKSQRTTAPCIENPEKTIRPPTPRVGLRMSDSPKPWYWRGGSSSPAPSPRGNHDDAAEVPLSQEESEALLEQLDEQWFCSNVVRWPSSRPGSPPGVIDKEVASPFRRRELSTTQAVVAAGAIVKPRAHLNPACSRPDARRASDGDHHLRRYLERDQIPHPHRVANNSSSTNPSRFATSFSPLEPLTGVTEDEEMENDLFAKMLANRPAKLTTINPGRQQQQPARDPLQENRISSMEIFPAKKLQRQRRRLKGTKSLTDLEYEELRGLKDLGFEVSKDDLTPHVVRMFPGLQRQGIPPYTHLTSQDVKVRIPGSAQPHLLWPRRPDSPLLNAPALDPSIDMKGQLKSWASEMASIVSIEC